MGMGKNWQNWGTGQLVSGQGHGRVGLGCREKSLVFIRVGNNKLPLLKDLTLQYDV